MHPQVGKITVFYFDPYIYVYIYIYIFILKIKKTKKLREVVTCVKATSNSVDSRDHTRELNFYLKNANVIFL